MLQALEQTVAVIDTGVDPHPARYYKNVLGLRLRLSRAIGLAVSETTDVQASPNTSQATTAIVNQRTVAVLDQRTVAVLGWRPLPRPLDTETHDCRASCTWSRLQAKIMPLKKHFSANGTGYDSDILRAIYYAVNHGAKVMNMSFDFSSYSPELARAIQYSNSKRRDFRRIRWEMMVSIKRFYPGGLPGVIDGRLDFEHGCPVVVYQLRAHRRCGWLHRERPWSPQYPWGTYAAGWGTSFSTPFVARYLQL